MPEASAGTVEPLKTTPESAAAEKAVSPEGSAKPSAEVQKRIDELTGELGRKNAKLEKLEADMAAFKEAQKTEREKELDAAVKERTGPQLARLAELELSLRGEFDEVMKSIPDNAKAAIMTGDSIPIEAQLKQAKAVLSLIGTQKGQPFTAGANTGAAPKRQITKQEFEAWQQLPGSGRPDSIKEWESQKAEMHDAYREGRIVGL